MDRDDSDGRFKILTDTDNERLSILTGGNIGIGIANPTNPLHIASNTLSQLNIQALSGNTNAQINLEPAGTGIALIGPANNVDFAFRTNATERMRITSGGNVGIGMDNPGARLHVTGTVEANGSLYRAIFGGTSAQDADMTGLTGGNGSEVQIQAPSITRGAYLTLGGGMNFGEAMGGIAFYNSNNVDGKRNRAFIVGGQEGATAGEQGSYLSFGTVANTISVPSEQMRITSGGNVGIGVNPSTRFHVVGESRFGTSTNFVSTFADSSGVYFENTGTTTLTRQIRIQGLNDAGNAYTQFFINHGAGNYQFWVNDQARIRIDGDGLKFNADTAAANALDDYEEGTWTPTSVSGGLTFSIQVARYTKVGRLVTAQCYVNMPTGGNTSAVVMGGLPFTNLTNGWAPGALDVSACSRIGGVARVAQNSTEIGFIVSSGSTSLPRFEIQGNEFGNDSYIILTVTYQTS
jgi:hypothetical protein